MSSAKAQWSHEWLKNPKNKHLLYTNGDLMVGNSSGGNLGMSFVYNAKYSIQVGYSAAADQFKTPLSGLKSASKSNANEVKNPIQQMENFNVMFGRHFNLNAKETTRFVLQGGPGMSVMMEWLEIQSGSGSNSIINKKLEETKDFSLMINSKFEFPITNLLGFSAGPTLIVNHDKSFLAFNVGFMYGILTKN